MNKSEFLKTGKLLVEIITGKPGTGKTQLAKSKLEFFKIRTGRGWSKGWRIYMGKVGENV